MADRYVRSTDGSDADNGTTWALAKATLVGVAAIDTAGDRLFLSQVHSESTSASIAPAFAGTLASPTLVICGDDAAEPPTAVAATAVVATGSGAYSITLSGVVWFYGVIFKAGVGSSSNINLSLATGDQNYTRLENCELWLASTGTSSRIRVGDSGSGIESRVELIDCDMHFASTAQGIEHRGAKFCWSGGALVSGSSAITTLCTLAHTIADILLENLDLSGLPSTCNLFAAAATGSGRAVIRNCKLPASWTGVLVATITGVNVRFEMYNCDNADTNYVLWVEDYAGSTKSETTIIRTGGASDGTTGLSWKMVTSASAEYPPIRLESPEIVQWNETAGSSVTATVEIVHDSQGAGSGSKFQDDEVWVEVMYLGTSGYPLGTWVTDCKADVLATAANQADSSETWTTTGLTTPVKQALSVTFTPQEKGFIHARVVLAKASKTCYVCPKLTVA